MTNETILLDVKDEAATITLNRPERLNAWTTEMAAELSDALSACNERDEVRVVVVTGAGQAFCAGADLGKGVDSFLEKRAPQWKLSVARDKPGLLAKGS